MTTAQDIVERLLSPLAISKEHRDQAADTISSLTADNEALRDALYLANQRGDAWKNRAEAAESRADALAQEVERLKAEKENLQGVLQAAHDALKRDIPAKAFHAVRAAIRALANEEAGQ